MSANVWTRQEARRAATDVFRLAEDYPVLRPRGGGVERALVAAAAVELAERGGQKAVVDEVVGLLRDDELSRLVSLAEEVAAPRWRRLVDLVGADAALEPLLAGIVMTAVGELRPPPRWLVAMREGTADDAPGPLNVLASLLHAESVWSVDEVRAAQTLSAPLREPALRLQVIVSFARAEITALHVDRVRHAARAVQEVLPLEEAPRTTRDLSEALALVRRSRDAAVETCELLLLTYVMRLEGSIVPAPTPN